MIPDFAASYVLESNATRTAICMVSAQWYGNGTSHKAQISRDHMHGNQTHHVVVDRNPNAHIMCFLGLPCEYLLPVQAKHDVARPGDNYPLMKGDGRLLSFAVEPPFPQQVALQHAQQY